MSFKNYLFLFFLLFSTFGFSQKIFEEQLGPCVTDYFTIELKESIPQEMKGKFNDWAFGCDICQDVCPWNRFAKPSQEPLFAANESIIKNDYKDWEEITEEVFKKAFKNSPLSRPKFKGFKRNLEFIKPSQKPQQ